MSRKSFKDIEQIIRNAAEANTPAFDEAAWKKMEAKLDKEKERKRPFIFWLWWLLPLLIGGALIGNYVLNKPVKKSLSSSSVGHDSKIESPENKSKAINLNTNENNEDNYSNAEPTMFSESENKHTETTSDTRVNTAKKNLTGRLTTKIAGSSPESEGLIDNENNQIGIIPGKTSVKISPAIQETANEKGTQDLNRMEGIVRKKDIQEAESEEVMVVKIEAGKEDEEKVEKMVDSLIEKSTADKKNKKRISKFYVIVAVGGEASGVKLLAADKITIRTGLSVGYQLNSKFSLQAGFYLSNKKYKAGSKDYKTKPGSYWSTVDITGIDAACKVYEIPISLRYDFNAGKKLNMFASAGLSSYIMKKEEYYIYYDRYGTQHQAETYYQGNKSLFSVLRVTAGIEKKVGKQFSIFVSPGLAIPLAGVGEGEVKLYSTDLMIGLKLTPARKK